MVNDCSFVKNSYGFFVWMTYIASCKGKLGFAFSALSFELNCVTVSTVRHFIPLSYVNFWCIVIQMYCNMFQTKEICLAGEVQNITNFHLLQKLSRCLVYLHCLCTPTIVVYFIYITVKKSNSWLLAYLCPHRSPRICHNQHKSKQTSRKWKTKLTVAFSQVKSCTL